MQHRARIDRAVSDLRPRGPSRPPRCSVRTLGERMHELHTPGVSVAVIENFEIAWAGGFGIRTTEERAAVGVDTPFQAGSISKPVFALAVMRLCQEKHIDLDADIRTYLTSWQLPEGDDGWAARINFRQLLSHTAGTTVHGFPGYPADGTWPSVTQVLDGTPPANTPPVFVDLIPGMQFRFSGGGTTIAQLAVTDLVGQPFADLMHELVLAPLGMEDSSYQQPPSASLANRAAIGHPINGVPIPRGWHVYPEMAAAGLWTTARDLAGLGAELMRGLRGEPTGIGLSGESLAAMLRPQLPDQSVGSEFVGLGWYCAGEGDAFRFGHMGVNRGFSAYLRVYPGTGQGAAVLINSNEGWSLMEELLQALEREYRWPTLAQPRWGTSIAGHLQGAYRDGMGRVFRLEQTGGKLLLWIGNQDPIRLAISSDGILSAEVPQIKVRLQPSSEGAPTIALTQDGTTFEAVKLPEEP